MRDDHDRPPCPAYTTPRLAAVYDALNPLDAVDVFYLRLAGTEAPLTILDAGCGTGRLACMLAARGHEVTGFDPAPAMLAVARSRSGGTQVEWIEGDAATLPEDRTYDLVIMTGNVFQVFLTDDAALATLAAIRARLSPQGCFAFETRNPAVREWLSWTPAETAEVLDVPGEGRTEVHYDVAGERGGIVTYDTHFAFADGTRAVARSWLRFCPLDHVTALLGKAGLAAERLYGDWDETPFDAATSPEIIIVAKAA